MGRAFIIFGVILIAVAFVAPFGAGLDGFNLSKLPIPGITKPDASVLCRSGETLEQSSSGSARIPGTHTFASSVAYHCINARGERRDVTSDFVGGLGMEVTSFAQGIFGTAMIATVASLAGFFFLFAGIVLSLRKGIASGRVRVVTPVYADITGRIQGDTERTSGDAAQRLQKLESLHRSRLISDSEYEAKRKEILGQL